jgi:hypothetical protein
LFKKLRLFCAFGRPMAMNFLAGKPVQAFSRANCPGFSH